MSGQPSQGPMRIVFWGTYDIGKPRVRILRQGLRLHGVELLECHADLWSGIEDKSQVTSVGRWAKLLARAVVAYPGLILRYLRMPRHDVVLVAYPGLVDLFVLRMFAWLRRTPLAWDWFLSAYDTIVMDRCLLSHRNPVAWSIRAIEWLATRLADATFMDTAAHARRMEQLFGLAPGTIGRVWVGVEREHFNVAAGSTLEQTAGDGNGIRVLFYGQFIPLHGIATIVAAAQLLRAEPVRWLLVGRGQEAPLIRELLENADLPQLQWVEWVDYGDLCEALARSDVALGIFGSSDKAGSVIPNKAYQILAARRPLITRDSIGIRELVSHAPPAVQLVPAGNAAALAAAVMVIAEHRKSTAAHVPVPDLVERFDATAIGRQLLDILQALIRRGTPVS